MMAEVSDKTEVFKKLIVKRYLLRYIGLPEPGAQLDSELRLIYDKSHNNSSKVLSIIQHVAWHECLCLSTEIVVNSTQLDWLQLYLRCVRSVAFSGDGLFRLNIHILTF